MFEALYAYLPADLARLLCSFAQEPAFKLYGDFLQYYRRTFRTFTHTRSWVTGTAHRLFMVYFFSCHLRVALLVRHPRDGKVYRAQQIWLFEEDAPKYYELQGDWQGLTRERIDTDRGLCTHFMILCRLIECGVMPRECLAQNNPLCYLCSKWSFHLRVPAAGDSGQYAQCYDAEHPLMYLAWGANFMPPERWGEVDKRGRVLEAGPDQYYSFVGTDISHLRVCDGELVQCAHASPRAGHLARCKIST